MSNFDDMKLAVEALSGGKNTVVFDDIGMPSVMVVIPKMVSNALITGALETTHPAFIVDGVPQHHREQQGVQPAYARPESKPELAGSGRRLQTERGGLGSYAVLSVGSDCTVVQEKRHNAAW